MIELKFHKTLKDHQGEMKLNVELNLETGKIYCVNGSSGSGKSSLLKIMAGIMKADQRSLSVEGNTWFDDNINLKPQERDASMAFQNHLLFPNLNVRDNILFGAKEDVAIEALMNQLSLAELSEEFPAKLSGGQQQRVGIARALASGSSILLLDEILTSQDQEMRGKIIELIMEEYQKRNCTIFLVTHDLIQSAQICHQTIFMRNGKVVEVVKKQEVLSRLKNELREQLKSIDKHLS